MGVLTLAVIAGVAAPAAAQTSAPPPSTATPPTGTTLKLGQTPAPMPQTAGADTLQLSADQAVDMALQTSLGLKSARMNLDVAAQAISGARTSFLPQLQSVVQRTFAQQQPQDFTQGTTDFQSHGLNSTTTLQQALPWFGGGYRVNWSGSRQSSTGGVSNFNPQLRSSLTLGFTQPLWRNLGIDPQRAALRISQHNQSIADVTLQQNVAITQTQVRNSYYNLIANVQFRQVAQQNLDLMTEQLRGARARVDVGQAAPIDIIAAEAQVASFREQLIAADSAVSQAEDQLRTEILDPARADYWTVHIVPTDDIQVQPKDLDVATEEAAIKAALANRLDATLARKNIEVTDLNMKVDQNLTKPGVDLNASYSTIGTAGSLLKYNDDFSQVVSRTDRSFGGALGDTFISTPYPSWNLNVTVSYPIGRTAAQVALAQDEIRKNQQTTNLQATEIEIVREVRDAARGVRTAIQRMQASDAALQASQRTLDAKQQSFDVGLVSLFELQNQQQALAGAKQNAVGARMSYILALIRFDAVQRIQQ
jgi:HAE1 family hydrophobic/amphiphilic exporter-1